MAEWEKRHAARKEKSDRDWQEQSARIKSFTDRAKAATEPSPKSAFDNGDVVDLERQPDSSYS